MTNYTWRSLLRIIAEEWRNMRERWGNQGRYHED